MRTGEFQTGCGFGAIRRLGVAWAMIFVGVVGLGAMGGCVSRVPIRYAGPAPVEASNWSSVLPGEAIVDADDRGRHVAMTRRDEALGVRRESPTALADSWTRGDRPSLDNARRLFIPTTPNSVIYFGQRRESWWR